MKYISEKCRICGAKEYHELTYSNPSRKCIEYWKESNRELTDMERTMKYAERKELFNAENKGYKTFMENR